MGRLPIADLLGASLCHALESRGSQKAFLTRHPKQVRPERGANEGVLGFRSADEGVPERAAQGAASSCSTQAEPINAACECQNPMLVSSDKSVYACAASKAYRHNSRAGPGR